MFAHHLLFTFAVVPARQCHPVYENIAGTFGALSAPRLIPNQLGYHLGRMHFHIFFLFFFCRFSQLSLKNWIAVLCWPSREQCTLQVTNHVLIKSWLNEEASTHTFTAYIFPRLAARDTFLHAINFVIIVHRFYGVGWGWGLVIDRLV